MHTIFWTENLERRVYFEDLDVDEEIILECVLGKYGWKGVDWTHLD
jgi:hypothetical protein